MKDLSLAKGKRSVLIEEIRLALVTNLDELVDSLLLSKENQSSLTMKEEIELALTKKEDFNIDFDFDSLLKLLNCNEVPSALKNRIDFSNRLKTDYDDFLEIEKYCDLVIDVSPQTTISDLIDIILKG